MNIALFNKPYWVRRFGKQRNVRGYITADKEDFVVRIHVHPGTSQQSALPEGERRVTRLEGHGNVPLVAADQTTGKKGDLLYYAGEWYECVSSLKFDHTILSHWNYLFTLVPGETKNVDTEDPPETPPGEWTPDTGEGGDEEEGEDGE